jgi:hypothetical protein
LGYAAQGATELRVLPVDAAGLGQVIVIDTEAFSLEKTDCRCKLFHSYGEGASGQRLSVETYG